MSRAVTKHREALNGPSLRHRLEDEIERLIAMLDALDGDPDLEPSICGGVMLGTNGLLYVEDDREGGDVLDEGEPNDWDAEPSLGSFTRGGQTFRQEGWHYEAFGPGGDADD